jgi:hypothetical protein
VPRSWLQRHACLHAACNVRSPNLAVADLL